MSRAFTVEVDGRVFKDTDLVSITFDDGEKLEIRGDGIHHSADGIEWGNILWDTFDEIIGNSDLG